MNCPEHAMVLLKPLEIPVRAGKTVFLPIPAQVIVCRTRHAAITQPHLLKAA